MATSAVAHGLFQGNPFNLGISGGFSSPFTATTASDADLIVGWGCALNMWTMRHGSLIGATAKVVQVDLEDRALGANRPIDLGVLGDSAETATAVLAKLRSAQHHALGLRTPDMAQRIAEHARWNTEHTEDLSTAEVIDPRVLSREMDRILPAERIVSIDSGDFMGYPSAYLSVPDEFGFCFTQAFQSIDLGLYTAIGAAKAMPGRLPVLGAGDGGLRSNSISSRLWGGQQFPKCLHCFSQFFAGSNVSSPFGELATRAGVSTRALGYYEEQRLLEPERTRTGHRIYAEADVARVQLIQELFAAGSIIRAVDGVSFSIEAGETVTIIGESGSGKSTTAMGVLRLLPDDLAAVSGHAVLEGVDIVTQPKAVAKLRGRSVALIPQDAMTALSPVHTIGRQLGEAIRRKGPCSAAELRLRSLELLTQVRIPSPEDQLRKYPHQLSGGMLQRVLIAMALACDPVLLVADEPTSALDVTVQAGILDLLMELQERTGVAILMITHDLGVARLVSDRIHVMKNGRFVESGEVDQIVGDPQTDYTRTLLASVPNLGPWDGDPVTGTAPAPADLASVILNGAYS